MGIILVWKMSFFLFKDSFYCLLALIVSEEKFILLCIGMLPAGYVSHWPVSRFFFFYFSLAFITVTIYDIKIKITKSIFFFIFALFKASWAIWIYQLWSISPNLVKFQLLFTHHLLFPLSGTLIILSYIPLDTVPEVTDLL